MDIKLLTKQHLEFLSLKDGCTGLSESIHLKMPHCWKSHVTAQIKLETEFSIAICWQLNTLFLAIFDLRSSVVKSFFDCQLSGVSITEKSHFRIA